MSCRSHRRAARGLRYRSEVAGGERRSRFPTAGAARESTTTSSPRDNGLQLGSSAPLKQVAGSGVEALRRVRRGRIEQHPCPAAQRPGCWGGTNAIPGHRRWASANGHAGRDPRLVIPCST